MRKKFVSKRIWEMEYRTSSNSNIFGKPNKKKSLINIFITILCILCIGYFWKYIIQAWQFITHSIWKWTISIVSKTLWKEMKKDEFWNVNIMIIWYWWEKHSWWYLADSIMVASWNQKLWAVTMVSVPRDLYVSNKEIKSVGRINQVFSRALSRKHEFETWARAMMNQLQDIMWINISYYVLIDFNGFEKVIDTLWGVEINVPKPIVDTTYPDGKLGYMTFRVSSGVQIFSWDRALMYARSRHSTSDFDRSLRQQQIIKAIIEKVKQQWFKPSTAKKLYQDYVSMVNTNISLDEVIWLSQYIDSTEHIFSYGFTMECSNIVPRLSRPWCFLYPPSRDLFWWASVILPIWSTPTNTNFYDYTQKFAFYVMHNQEYLIENAKIMIWNWIDKQYAKQQRATAEKHASQIGVKLKKYGFNVLDTKNAKTPYLQTEIYILWTGTYENTINMLKTFLPIEKVTTIVDKDWFILPGLWSEEMYQQQQSGTELLLILGNSYINYTQWKKFDYYK